VNDTKTVPEQSPFCLSAASSIFTVNSLSLKTLQVFVPFVPIVEKGGCNAMKAWTL
jgi:hypothetical protein